MRNRSAMFLHAMLLLVMNGYGEDLRIGVSVLPLETLLREIGGDYVNVLSLQQEGDNCSVFEPRPSSISWLAGADLFFRTGVGYESIVLEKIERQHRKLKVLDLRNAVEGVTDFEHEHVHVHEHEHGHGHGEATYTDPHLWMDPLNLAEMGEWIAGQLSLVQPEHEAYFTERAQRYRMRMLQVNRQIKELLDPFAGRAFFIYHPALSYFARRYDLHQEAIEQSGHAPSIGELNRLIRKARSEGIGMIFIQPQESRRHAEVVAEAIGARIEEIDPMAQDLVSNLLKISKSLAQSFNLK